MVNPNKFNELKALLLNEDRVTISKLEQRIDELELQIKKQQESSNKVGQLIDDKLVDYSNNLPKKLGPKMYKSAD